MNRALLRPFVKWAGRLVAVTAVVFIVFALHRQWAEISARSLGPAIWAWVFAMGIGYGIAMLLIAEAWHQLISDFARKTLPRRLSWPSYAVAQPAKYIPGNVFQYITRHGFLVRAGVANMALLKAMTWDMALLVVASSVSGMLAFLAFPMAIAFVSAEVLRNIAIAAAVGFGVAAIALVVSPRLQRLAGSLRPRSETVVKVILLFMLFFACQALIFVFLGQLVSGRLVPQLATVVIVSWLFGVVPMGTPGGLGTREAMLLLLGGPLIGTPDALVLAGLFRLVTMLGDGSCAAIGWLIARTAKDTTAS